MEKRQIQQIMAFKKSCAWAKLKEKTYEESSLIVFWIKEIQSSPGRDPGLITKKPSKSSRLQGPSSTVVALFVPSLDSF